MNTTFGQDREVKSRKQHRCALCGLRIKKGAKYWTRCGVGDGGFWTLKMHAVCKSKSDKWDWWQWEEIRQGWKP